MPLDYITTMSNNKHFQFVQLRCKNLCGKFEIKPFQKIYIYICLDIVITNLTNNYLGEIGGCNNKSVHTIIMIYNKYY